MKAAVALRVDRPRPEAPPKAPDTLDAHRAEVLRLVAALLEDR